MVVKIWTSDGVIVLEDLPDQATVLIDEKKATVHWPDSGGPAEISAPPGEHVVQVKKDGYKLHGKAVKIEAGGRTLMTARLDPLDSAPPKKGDADHTAPRTEIRKTAAPTTARHAAKEPAQPRASDAVRSPDGKVKIVSGLWHTDGRELVQQNPDGGMCVLIDDPSLSRFEIRFSAMVVAGREGFSAVFHYSSPGDCCQLSVGDSGRRTIAICPRYRGKWEFHGKPKGIPTELGRWYDVRVKINGPEYQCFLDDKELFHNTLDERFVKGGVGLGAWDSVVRYRDITISTPEGRILWKGPPDLPGQKRGQSDAAPRPPAVVVSGQWRVEQNELVQKDGPGTILLGDKELSSYDLTFEGQIVSGKEGFVALFHRTNDDNTRFFHVGELDGNRVDLGLLHRGNEGGKSSPTPTVKGRWYKVWVKVRGAECWCYLDGDELLHDVDSRFTKGRVGLATWDAIARFRDVVITSPEGKVLWSGLPQLSGN